jgi:hypothetical protein
LSGIDWVIGRGEEEERGVHKTKKIEATQLRPTTFCFGENVSVPLEFVLIGRRRALNANHREFFMLTARNLIDDASACANLQPNTLNEGGRRTFSTRGLSGRLSLGMLKEPKLISLHKRRLD